MIRKAARFALLAVCCTLSVYAINFPKPSGYVVDAANIIEDSAQAALEKKLSDFEKQTFVEISVATVPSLEGESVEIYAVQLFKEWGIGKKGKNNGVLLLVAPTERKMRIEVGYGLEGVLPDGLCGDIIREQLRPAFKEGRFEDGIADAADRMMKILQGDSEAAVYRSDADESYQDLPAWGAILFFSVFVGLGFFMFGAGLRSKTFFPIVWGSFFGGLPLLISLAVVSGIGAKLILPVFGFLMTCLGWRVGKTGTYFRSSGSSDGWIMGGSSSSGGFGGGGGFGGFGGGSSGGGGASGGW